MKLYEVTGKPLSFTSIASDYVERLAQELDVPRSSYEEAQRRYESVGRWMCRDESSLKDLAPDVYVQGSFRLGTPIRPVNDAEDYDIDLVCELQCDKGKLTQQELKARLGVEMELYAKAHSMSDVVERRRCWTLQYARGAQFHLDALPALPDGQQRQRLLVEARVKPEWAETAIGITDLEHRDYERISPNWPHSNPRGYSEWFRSRSAESFRQIREALALNAQVASVEEIPEYDVKTPLQQVVQILKRHRDLMFIKDPEHKPISVVLTTLAGQAYEGEAKVADAVAGVLNRLERYIHRDKGIVYIWNPTDPRENFADKWVEQPLKRQAFEKWLLQAKDDFSEISQQINESRLVEVASRSVGDRPARGAKGRAPRSYVSLGARLGLTGVAHKQPAPWPASSKGGVSISEATWTAKGFSRPLRFHSGGEPLPKGASLNFVATTNVPAPYDVYWQIVNTGAEAAAVPNGRGLRGGFDQGVVGRGGIRHHEDTEYSGSHTIECFIVKDRHLAARSGAFVVNIR